MFNKSNIIDKIEKSIKNKEEISPFLFIWNDLEKINSDLENIIFQIFSHFWEDKNNFFKLKDDWNSIKVKDIRIYLERSFIKSNSLFQIFFIENISRFTDESANAMLKFLEEPWIWNIIFLTNSWENNILETIISRVQLIQISNNSQIFYDDKYFSMLENFVSNNDFYIFSYFYKEKLDKEDYVLFLKTLIYFIEKKLVFRELLDLVYETLNSIISQPIMPKYHVDKILLKLEIWKK